MTLASGTRLGPYELLASIGAGGMGEVYRARDTRLERTVAVKVLSSHLAASAESRQRFEREARTISQLSHAHICALYDVGREGEVEYLVMEYLEGETLSDRLLKGALPFDQVLRYGTEIADALDKAHRSGVVHRDLKPGNVMLTKSGVKLLDFGLAKAMAVPGAGSGASLTALPTQMGSNLTQEGTILGTFQYMAPEQLEGKEADARTDLFAFGAVLYEMATGRKAFSGGSQASLISSIMGTEPPPISTVAPMTPPAFDRVVRTCLAKDPDDRWQTAHDVGVQLKWIQEGGSAVGLPAPVAAQRKTRERLTWALIGLMLGSVAAGLVGWALLTRRAPAPRPVTRFTVALPVGAFLTGVLGNRLALSPDGRRLAFVGSQGGKQQVYARRLDQFEFAPVPGTDGASQLFFSPDGEWIGFYAAGSVRKVSVGGGVALPVCSAPTIFGAVWAPDDSIWFGSRQGLMRVSASGGVPEVATKLEKGEASHRYPQILPGDKAVLFVVSRTTGTGFEIVAQSLETGRRASLIRPGGRPRYVHPGYLIYTSGDGSPLLAVPFDVERLQVKGAPVPVTEGSVSQYDVSRNGTLASLPALSEMTSALAWVDGKGAAQTLSSPAHYFEQPRVSPDGRSIAVANREGNPDVWVYGLDRGTLVRITFDPDEDETPVWTPDGKRVTYRRGDKVLWKPADGSGTEELLATVENNPHLGSWSPDGRMLAFNAIASTGEDIFLLSTVVKGPPRPFLQTPFNERGPMFSPDGRWLAYTSDESARDEVYVQAFPGPGGKWQISTEGGSEPVWARDGKRLFYVSGSRLMGVAVQSEPTFAAGEPQMMFEGPYSRAHRELGNYDVSPDGRRFLMISGKETTQTRLHVVLDWFGELDRLASKEKEK